MSRRAHGRIDGPLRRPLTGSEARRAAPRPTLLRPANDNPAPLRRRLGFWCLVVLFAVAAGLAVALSA